MSTVLSDVIGRGVLASRPTAGVAGRLYEATDGTPPTIYRDNGSSWDTFGTVSGSASPTTTRGDLIRRGASADERVALGAAGKFLTSDGTDAVWGQGPLTTTGDLLIGATGGTPTRLAAGTNGYVLTSGGAGVAPSWAAGGGGGTPTASQYGKTAIGGSSEATVSRRVYCKSFTLSAKALVTGINLYVTPNAGGNVPEVAVGIAINNAGTPGRIIAAASLGITPAGETSSPTSRWITFPITAVLAAGTYWMEVMCAPTANSWTVFYDGGTGTDKYYGTSGAFVYDGAIATFTTPTKDYSIFVDAIAVS